MRACKHGYACGASSCQANFRNGSTGCEALSSPPCLSQEAAVREQVGQGPSKAVIIKLTSPTRPTDSHHQHNPSPAPELSHALESAKLAHQDAIHHIKHLLGTIGPIKDENSSLKARVAALEEELVVAVDAMHEHRLRAEEVQEQAATAMAKYTAERERMISAFREEAERFKSVASRMKETMHRMADEKAALQGLLDAQSRESAAPSTTPRQAVPQAEQTTDKGSPLSGSAPRPAPLEPGHTLSALETLADEPIGGDGVQAEQQPPLAAEATQKASDRMDEEFQLARLRSRLEQTQQRLDKATAELQRSQLAASSTTAQQGQASQVLQDTQKKLARQTRSDILRLLDAAFLQAEALMGAAQSPRAASRSPQPAIPSAVAGDMPELPAGCMSTPALTQAMSDVWALAMEGVRRGFHALHVRMRDAAGHVQAAASSHAAEMKAREAAWQEAESGIRRRSSLATKQQVQRVRDECAAAIAAEQGRVEELQRYLAQQAQEHHTLKQKLHAAELKVKELDEILDEGDEELAALRPLKGQLEALTQDMQRLREATANELRKAEATHAAQLESAVNEVRTSELKSAEERLEQQRGELQRMHDTELAALQDRLQAALEANRADKESIDTLKAKLQSTSAAADSLEASLREELAQAGERISALQASESALTSRAELAEEQAVQLKGQVAILEQGSALLSSRVGPASAGSVHCSSSVVGASPRSLGSTSRQHDALASPHATLDGAVLSREIVAEVSRIRARRREVLATEKLQRVNTKEEQLRAFVAQAAAHVQRAFKAEQRTKTARKELARLELRMELRQASLQRMAQQSECLRARLEEREGHLLLAEEASKASAASIAHAQRSLGTQRAALELRERELHSAQLRVQHFGRLQLHLGAARRKVVAEVAAATATAAVDAALGGVDAATRDAEEPEACRSPPSPATCTAPVLLPAPAPTQARPAGQSASLPTSPTQPAQGGSSDPACFSAPPSSRVSSSSGSAKAWPSPLRLRPAALAMTALSHMRKSPQRSPPPVPGTPSAASLPRTVRWADGVKGAE